MATKKAAKKSSKPTRNTLPYSVDEALAYLRAADPKLGALIDRSAAAGHRFGIDIESRGTPFEALLRAILYQQLHGKAAATIHRRVRLLYAPADLRTAIESAIAAGDPHEHHLTLLTDPHPQLLLDTPDDLLRAAGVSGNKIKAMRDLAARVLDGTVPTHKAIVKLSDTEILERLTQVRGIGAWTVEMLLIFRLGRPDIFPVTDFGVRKGFLLTFGRVPKTRAITQADLPTPEQMLRRAKKWSPYRSVAAWYMWRACDLDALSRAKTNDPATDMTQ
jgi:DNA-3-methyladenine glycosylase II